MNTYQPPHRPHRLQRALVLALVIAVNAGITGFIDHLAGARPAQAEMALTTPAAAARA